MHRSPRKQVLWNTGPMLPCPPTVCREKLSWACCRDTKETRPLFSTKKGRRAASGHTPALMNVDHLEKFRRRLPQPSSLTAAEAASLPVQQLVAGLGCLPHGGRCSRKRGSRENMKPPVCHQRVPFPQKRDAGLFEGYSSTAYKTTLSVFWGLPAFKPSWRV